MSTSIIRRRSKVDNAAVYFNGKINNVLSVHQYGDIPLLDMYQHMCPTGSITAFLTGTPPFGWKICNGDMLLRESFPNLFNVIGNQFGGDGITTFRLPDLRGAFLRMTGMNSDENSGPELGEIQHDSLASHTHTATTEIEDPGHSHVQSTVNDDFNNSYTVNGDPAGPPTGQNPSFPAWDSAGERTWNNISSSTTGISASTIINSSGSNETRPFCVGVNYIVKCI